jgi:hypothetical protein
VASGRLARRVAEYLLDFLRCDIVLQEVLVVSILVVLKIPDHLNHSDIPVGLPTTVDI